VIRKEDIIDLHNKLFNLWEMASSFSVPNETDEQTDIYSYMTQVADNIYQNLKLLQKAYHLIKKLD
jgi:hypothetical protein